MITFSRTQHIIYQTIILLIIGFNATYLHSKIIGVSIGLIYLATNSKKLKDIFFKENILTNFKDPKKREFFQNILALIIILAYVSIAYTLAYHLALINTVFYIFIIISIPFLVEILSWKFNTNHYFFKDINPARLFKLDLKNTWTGLLILIIDILLFYYLSQKMSSGIIRSPWELVNYKFWFLLTLSNILLIIHFPDIP